MRTARILKKSWTTPAPNALLNSIRLEICPNDTKVFVIVVPMLAPIIIGIAVSIVNAPPATSPTTSDVVVEELCIILVATIPIINPENGFVVILISVSANPCPNELNECPKSFIESKNK